MGTSLHSICNSCNSQLAEWVLVGEDYSQDLASKDQPLLSPEQEHGVGGSLGAQQSLTFLNQETFGTYERMHVL